MVKEELFAPDPDQYTTLGASSGPDVPRLNTFLRTPDPPRFPHCDHGVPVVMCARCAGGSDPTKTAIPDCTVTRHIRMCIDALDDCARTHANIRDGAYRRGRLDGMARTAAVVLGLVVLGWALGRGR